jgi:serine/threonine-protein kinase
MTAGPTVPARRSTVGTVTALDALRSDEARRTRALMIGELVTVGCVGALGLVAPGPERVRPWVVAFAALSVILCTASLRWREFTATRLLVTHLPVIPFVVCAYMFFGVWSFFAAASAVGTFVFAMGSSRAFAVLSYFLMASVPAVGMLGLATGLIQPMGMVRAPPMPVAVQLGFLLYLQIYFASMYWLGRASRNSQIAAMRELEEALRKVDERDALLDEAQRDLDRLEGRGQARWSGATLGAWKLGPLLGRGGMGEVYSAIHVESGSPAAVKLVSLEAEDSPQIVERFRREAEILRRLRHPSIVTLFDVGEHHGMPYLVMERLSGESLSAILRRVRRLPLSEVRDLVSEIAAGLEHALGHEVVHRDLKPQNLIRLEETGRWKVLDFGVSKLGEGATLTRGHAIGTPGYMAPEQIRGGRVDHRADVFALTAVAYRCLSGVPAFSGDHARILYQVIHAQPRKPAVKLPHDVELVLALGLAKSPAERIPKASALAQALSDACDGRLDPALRARGEALLRRHPWGGYDADDARTERIAGG